MYDEMVYSRAMLTLLAALSLPILGGAEAQNRRFRIAQMRRQLTRVKLDLEFDSPPYGGDPRGR